MSTPAATNLLSASFAAPADLPVGVRKALEAVAPGFVLSEDRLRDITSTMLEEFEAGLARYGEPMAMIPTYVTGVPDGSETGYALLCVLCG